MSIGSNPCLKCTPSWQTLWLFWNPSVSSPKNSEYLHSVEVFTVQHWRFINSVLNRVQKSIILQWRQGGYVFCIQTDLYFFCSFLKCTGLSALLLLSESKFFPRLKTWFGCLWLQSIDQYTCFSTSLNSKMFQMSIMEWDLSALTVDCWPGSGREHPMLKVKMTLGMNLKSWHCKKFWYICRFDIAYRFLAIYPWKENADQYERVFWVVNSWMSTHKTYR